MSAQLERGQAVQLVTITTKTPPAQIKNRREQIAQTTDRHALDLAELIQLALHQDENRTTD